MLSDSRSRPAHLTDLPQESRHRTREPRIRALHAGPRAGLRGVDLAAHVQQVRFRAVDRERDLPLPHHAQHGVRRVELALCDQSADEVAEEDAVLRLDDERAPVELFGARAIARVLGEDRQVVDRVHVERVRRHGALERGDRLRPVAPRVEVRALDVVALVLRQPVAQPVRGGDQRVLPRRLEVGVAERERELHVRRGEGAVLRDRVLEQRGRLRKVPLDVVGAEPRGERAQRVERRRRHLRQRGRVGHALERLADLAAQLARQPVHRGDDVRRGRRRLADTPPARPPTRRSAAAP